MRYELYYQPSIQGRGEFVRLPLEDAGADYIDVARDPNFGRPGIMKFHRRSRTSTVRRCAAIFESRQDLDLADREHPSISRDLGLIWCRKLKRPPLGQPTTTDNSRLAV